MQIIKNLAFLIVAIAAITFTSCEKEETVPAEIAKEELFERTISLEDETGLNAANITFKAANQQLLDEIQANEFKLIAVYEEPAPAPNDSQEPSFANKLTEKVQEVKMDKVISIEVETIRQAENAKGLALEWKKEDPKTPQAKSLYPTGYHVAFHTSSWARRIQLNNYSYNPLNVSFYYDSCNGNYCTSSGIMGRISKYSGYSYRLYRNGWAWYYHCSKQVGAYVSAGYNSYHYRWTWWSVCRP